MVVVGRVFFFLARVLFDQDSKRPATNCLTGDAIKVGDVDG